MFGVDRKSEKANKKIHIKGPKSKDGLPDVLLAEIGPCFVLTEVNPHCHTRGGFGRPGIYENMA